ncbi:rhodanese-like domain-containing protein [Salinarimonas soli]|uniref:Sulfurtransferase n=1 Tax=Salinarimonas soli TaxID=1638099 RepID=A0A5B2V736_9HYPH|nr:rhodanese-like domain-containing protein [Salinarimonas soli]KAA2234385.1 sulfurtransferase [Salinarimonas soli]
MNVVDVDVEAVKEGLADGSMLVVDVREPHEYAAGHIPTAVNHPLSTFDPGALPLDAGKRIVFACNSGARTLKALEATQNAGIDLREHYRGSFKEWSALGLPVE